MSTDISISRDVADGNIVVGKDNRIDRHEVPVTIHNNNARDTIASVDAIRLAIFGDTSLNFKGLIMRLDELEQQLRTEISELRTAVRLLQVQVDELRKNILSKNIHFIISVLNFLAIIVSMIYLYSK